MSAIDIPGCASVIIRVAYCDVDSPNALSSSPIADRIFSQTLRTMKVSDPTSCR
jgi:hypothetical protein